MHTYSRNKWHPIPARIGLQFCRAVAVALIPLLAGGCREVGPSFGSSIPAARANAEGLFGGVAFRFTNVQRNTKYAHARGRMGKNALTPSQIYNDTSVWNGAGPDGTRTLTVEGEFSNGRYAINARPSLTPANSPGDTRHRVVLRKIDNDEFEWLTSVDFAAGTITAQNFSGVISALLRSSQNRSAAAIRADYRESFPRTTASLGRLFTLDSLRATPDADGATNVTLGIRLNPKRLRATMPAFADYLEKYSTESRYRAVVTDKRGVRWLEFSGANNFLTLRLRTIDGRFAPMIGPVRPMPADLTLTSDFTTRILLFNVGFRRLVGDVSVLSSERERGWLLRFTHEPEWKLPPAVGYLIKSPLRRPFQGSGAMFRIAINDASGRQSIIARRTSATVQESAILRFLNRLSGTAMGDFVGKAETEENRFNAEVFNALRLDARALLQ